MTTAHIIEDEIPLSKRKQSQQYKTLIQEFELIKQKKSKLCREQRKKVFARLIWLLNQKNIKVS